jgi:hypothetical protein
MDGGLSFDPNAIRSLTETVERWLPVIVTVPVPLPTDRALTGEDTV